MMMYVENILRKSPGLKTAYSSALRFQPSRILQQVTAALPVPCLWYKMVLSFETGLILDKGDKAQF